MITILVVGSPGTEPSAYASGHPSVEILVAGGTEDALEKLARNRRIDAVLLLGGSATAELAAALSEEDPAAPPLYAPASVGTIPWVTGLPATDASELLDLLVRTLDPEP